MAKSRICIISFYFPPMNAIGFLRPLRLANYAASEGHNVVVLMGSPRAARHFVSVDPALATRVNPRVKVVNVPTLHLFSKIFDLRNALRVRRSDPAPAAAASPSAEAGATTALAQGKAGPTSSVRECIELIQKFFLVPDRYQSFIVTGFFAYLRHFLFARPDYIYVTGPPWSPMALGVLLSKLFRIPLTVDYRDPWNHNPYTVLPSYKRIQFALEGSALNQSRRIIFNTESMRKLYVEKLAQIKTKATAIYNGVDEDLAREMQRLKEDVVREEKTEANRFVVIHAGRLYAQRMPANLADTLAEVAAGWDEPRDILFRFVGGAEDAALLQRAFHKRGMDHKLHLAGSVSAKEAKLAQLRADCILLLQLGTGIQLPAKIFECALAGKPIVCFADPDSETAEFVKRYRLGALFDGSHSSAEIGAALRSKMRSEAPRVPSESLLRDFSGKSLAAALLAEVQGGPSSSGDSHATG